MKLPDSRPRFASTKIKLPLGLIFEIARTAGIDVPTDRSKVQIRCPFHDDKNPSAVLFETNRFYCSSCSLKLSAKGFAEKLGLPWRSRSRLSRRARSLGSVAPPKDSVQVSFTEADALSVWQIVLDRVRSTPHEDDQAVHSYLEARGLSAALDTGCAGILPKGIHLPLAVSVWIFSGHRLIAPLYDSGGEVVNIQSRAIVPVKLKTLFVEGSKVSGRVFASTSGIDLLRGSWRGDPRVLYGEGLTDSLAYAIACPFPALAAPGTPTFVAGIGLWAHQRHVVLAPDCDEAGDAVVDDAIAAAFRFGALSVTRLRWPKGAKDACDVLQEHGAVALRRILERAPRGDS